MSGATGCAGRSGFGRKPPKGDMSGRARRVSPGRLSLVLAKESPPDPERKAALGALIYRGMGLSWRFNIFTLVSLNLYETGVRSFSRDGALRRSAYRGRFVERPRSAGISWEAFFGLGQRKPPRPRKESRFGCVCVPGSTCYSAVRHRYVGIPWTLRDWGAVFFARRRFAPVRLRG